VADQVDKCEERAGLWLRHCRQMPRAYDVEGAYDNKIMMSAKYFEQACLCYLIINVFFAS